MKNEISLSKLSIVLTYIRIKLKSPRCNAKRIPIHKHIAAAGYLSRAWRKGREYRSVCDLPHDARRRRYIYIIYTYTYRHRHESSDSGLAPLE